MDKSAGSPLDALAKLAQEHVELEAERNILRALAPLDFQARSRLLIRLFGERAAQRHMENAA